MNRYFLLLWVFCAFAINCRAQSVFAPPGAHWYNWADDGYYHSFTDGDTVILGITVRKIHQRAVVGPSSWASSLPDIYIYGTPDTVYVYNQYFGRFTPLYIFDVHEGDTVRIPTFFDTAYTYSTFTFRVDSVKMVLYDTTLLKTVYTSTLDTLTSGSYPYGVATYGREFSYNHQDRGSYSQLLGRSYGGLYPSYRMEGMIPQGCGCPGNIHCYSDPTTSIKLISGECDPPVSVQYPDKRTESNVWPNPASEILQTNAGSRSTIKLLSSDGREVMRKVAETGRESIDLSGVQSGIYLLRITGPDGAQTRKIIVQH